MLKAIIFDFDGTIVNSSWMWNSFCFEFLDSLHAVYNKQELLNEIEKLTMPEATRMFIDKFSINMTEKEVFDILNKIVYDHYNTDIELKDGVFEYLQKLKSKNIPMCIVSVTEESLIRLCLDRLGVLDCFEFIFSCENMGLSKREPTIYLEAAKRLNAKPDEIAVYEDMLHTIETAKSGGFYTVGVYDGQAEDLWNEICNTADETIDYTKVM